MTTEQISSGRRVRRGALRLGFLTSGIAFALIVGSALLDAHRDIDTKVAVVEQAHCMMGLSTPTLDARKNAQGVYEFLLKENGCPGPRSTATEAELRAIGNVPRPVFASVMLRDSLRGIVVAIVAALVIVALSWGVGWALAGFTSDAR